MNYALGVPKDMRVVVEERGVNTHGMVAEQMREVPRGDPDISSMIERFLVEERGHVMYMIPKFHCELNPIERVCAQAKR